MVFRLNNSVKIKIYFYTSLATLENRKALRGGIGGGGDKLKDMDG